MKKFVSLLLVLAMALTFTACKISLGSPTDTSTLPSSAPESPAPDTQEPTQAPTEPVILDAPTVFEDALKDAKLIYTNEGIAEDGSHHFSLSYESSYVDQIVVECFVSDEYLDLYAWYLVEVPAENTSKALEVLNELNSSYRYAVFSLDTADSTVTASYNVWFSGDESFGVYALDAIDGLVSVVDAVYPQLLSLEETGA
ncbi:MAG TPA: hypothetical protein IAC31_04875 [Candidatus Faecousia intestinigallinarum]|nr:hypothetical protein [Candidatus Faecousia intestinigallinarum]